MKKKVTYRIFLQSTAFLIVVYFFTNFYIFSLYPLLKRNYKNHIPLFYIYTFVTLFKNIRISDFSRSFPNDFLCRFQKHNRLYINFKKICKTLLFS